MDTRGRFEGALLYFGTAHALRRANQRGIKSEIVDLIYNHYDRELYAGNGCYSVGLSAGSVSSLRERGYSQQLLERARKVVLILSEDGGGIITLLRPGTGKRGRNYRRQCATRKRSPHIATEVQYGEVVHHG